MKCTSSKGDVYDAYCIFALSHKHTVHQSGIVYHQKNLEMLFRFSQKKSEKKKIDHNTHTQQHNDDRKGNRREKIIK